MSTASEYLKLAEECYQLAKEAKTDTDRQACLDLAQTWIEAAAQQQDEARKRLGQPLKPQR